MEPHEFYHKEVIAEESLDTKTLPKDMQNSLRGFDLGYLAYKKYGEKPETLDKLKKTSAILADEIQTWLEKDLPDEEQTNNNQNNMTQEQEALIARAKAVGLPETSTEAEIVEKETAFKAKSELSARAIAVGLPETATEAEIVTAETEKANPKKEEKKVEVPATPNKDEANKKAVADQLAKWGRVYYADLQKVVQFPTGTEEVEYEGVKLKRKVAYYYKQVA